MLMKKRQIDFGSDVTCDSSIFDFGSDFNIGNCKKSSKLTASPNIETSSFSIQHLDQKVGS